MKSIGPSVSFSKRRFALNTFDISENFVNCLSTIIHSSSGKYGSDDDDVEPSNVLLQNIIVMFQTKTFNQK